ncbi:MAG: hypothetical protein ACOC9P_03040 [bacterium]
MTALWEIGGLYVHRLQGSSRFNEFMNALLRAAARGGGVTAAALDTTLRETIPDGGVDAAVHHAATKDSTGWISFPTVWQYKAQSFTNAFGSGADKQARNLIRFS